MAVHPLYWINKDVTIVIYVPEDIATDPHLDLVVFYYITEPQQELRYTNLYVSLLLFEMRPETPLYS